MSSIISKSIASLCTYPHEVIRNSIQNLRNQVDRKGMIRKVVRNIVETNGYIGLYAGFHLNLFRILPNNAVMFVAYEFLSRFLAK